MLFSIKLQLGVRVIVNYTVCIKTSVVTDLSTHTWQEYIHIHMFRTQVCEPKYYIHVDLDPTYLTSYT